MGKCICYLRLCKQGVDNALLAKNAKYGDVMQTLKLKTTRHTSQDHQLMAAVPPYLNPLLSKKSLVILRQNQSKAFTTYYVRDGYSLYCLDPAIMVSTDNSIPEATDPCKGGYAHNSNCVGSWQGTDESVSGYEFPGLKQELAAQQASYPVPDGIEEQYCYGGSRIAFACYNEEENEIVFEDECAHSGVDTERICRSVLLATRPNLILVSNKVLTNAPLLECLTTMPLGSDGDNDGSNTTNAANARAGVAASQSETVAEEQAAGAGTSQNTTRTAAATTTIPYQLLKSSAFEPRPAVASFYKSYAKDLLLQSTLFVDVLRQIHFELYETTLRTLRIFATEHHPLVANNNLKGRSYQKSKEGFSLFTLLDRTKSKAGKERLRQWMTQPLRNVDKIRQRHVGIELFLHQDSHPAASLLLQKLSDIGRCDAILLRMQRCCAQPNDFLQLGRMLDAAYAIVATLSGELREKAHKLDRDLNHQAMEDMGRGTQQQQYPSVTFIDELLQQCHVPVLRNLRERMASVIDEEVTAEVKDHCVIHFGFHEELDSAKETFETLDETLSEVGRQVLAKHEELISLKVVFLPQVGFLVSIDKRQHAHDEATNSFPTIPDDFDFVFVQDDDAFFKNSDMNQLDEEIGDLDAFIKDTEALIVSDLEEDILECESELRSTFSALADLDCILSLAGCAADLNFVKPEIVSDTSGVIDIENGRHPLQELIVNDEFIPNDTTMDETNRVLVVTGPNFSGKSCYARQVGVLVYLAHVGSYLPCDSARISIFDQILVNFGDVETCAVPQSTFQRDLTQIAGIFHRRTAPASGISVMASALQRLADTKCKVVCTTHFLEMFSLGLLQDGVAGIKAVRMSIHIPESDEDDAVPLFKLEDGVASSSAGLVCARMAGLNKKVVDRCAEITDCLRDGKKIRPLPESVNANSPFQANVKSAIRLFLAVDCWKDASDEDLDLLKELVSRM
ncbi:DNA mismatch repair protein MutS family protein [Skeletonema marinoi]|uniref:DNA mismatch repair protein MutS family protein n=1 Tax=Skeletonema marinoi TaxID=267567 RepID=A0AAD9DE84_9STRA|nr:DNA mismatch repair protein MutS family protein [Skeletonema marinoi]